MRSQPPKSGNLRGRGRPLIAIAVLGCSLLLGACGSSGSKSTPAKTKLDTSRVARSIEQSILTQRHLRAKVVCPAAVPQEKGRVFECIATTQTLKRPIKTGKTPFVVTIKNKNGYVTYEGK